MDIINQLSFGIELMLVGMGTVFVFLVLLVFSILGMTKVISKVSKDVSLPGGSHAEIDTGKNNELSKELITVISSAVYHYHHKSP